MLTEFETRAEASAAAAGMISASLARRLESQKTASVVVSGGTTPGQCFDRLAATELDWERVNVVPSDERWVAEQHEDSNARLIRQRLLTGNAAPARLFSLYAEDTDIHARVAELNESGVVLLPFASVLLGMGSDGHFASLFPDAANLEEGLDVDTRTFCIAVETAASSHERLSLTLAALSRSDEIVLLIYGDDKRAVFEQACSAPDALPASALIWQNRAPVHTLWAP